MELHSQNIRGTMISPGAIAPELPESSSDEATRKNLPEFMKMALPASTIARAIAYAIEQPAEVEIDEVVVRPTALCKLQSDDVRAWRRSVQFNGPSSQFLQTLMGYTAQTAGMVISMAAVLLVFLLPVVGRLAGYFQARHLLAFGWIALAVAMYFSCKHIDLLISFRAAALMRIWQYLPGWILIRSAHYGCLCGPAGVKKQRCGRLDKLHPQYRAERRNLRCDYVACAPRSIPSVRSRRVHTLSSVRCGHRRLDESSDTCRFERAFRSATGGCQNVQRGDGAGSSTLLRRYLLVARCYFRADVFVVLPTCQK
jgi:hypothetical protein